MTTDRLQVLDDLRHQWYDRARPFEAPAIFGHVDALQPVHVQNARLFSDRDSALAALPTNSRVAEIGTLQGHFARKILQITRPAHLDILDISFDHLDRSNLEPGLSQGLVSLHLGDSSTTLSQFQDESFDWIYIDGDHRPDGVSKDAKVASTKVKTDGILVFNDYIFFSHYELEPYGVVQTVNAMCVNEGWEVVYLALASNMYCDIAIRRR